MFKTTGVKPKGVKCDATYGLIKEAERLMEETKGVVLDAGLLAACQAVEHYEIARYGLCGKGQKSWGMKRLTCF